MQPPGRSQRSFAGGAASVCPSALPSAMPVRRGLCSACWVPLLCCCPSERSILSRLAAGSRLQRHASRLHAKEPPACCASKEVDQQLIRRSLADCVSQIVPFLYLQIIARIHTANQPVRAIIHDVLVRIGRHHPQALMYPLLVACKSQSASRRNAAMSVVDNVRQHAATLVEQAQLVSQVRQSYSASAML